MKVSVPGKLVLILFACLSILFPGQFTSHRVMPSINIVHASTSQKKSNSSANPLTPFTKPTGKGVTSTQSKVITMPTLEDGTTGPTALWLNEALAVLRYLPLQVSVSSQSLITQWNSGDLTQRSLKWSWLGSYPLSLEELWNPNEVTTMTQGAVMRFQHDHGLVVDGIAGPQVERALLQSLTARQVDAEPYTYVLVSKSGTEHLDVWQNGQKIYTSLANTGIQASQTPKGTFPVYWRLTSQTMSGKNPDGQSYHDAGVPWVNYFDKGCAIHGFPRATYGWPQSLGCVELPIAAAKQVYSLIDYGTLVTIA